jgi:hypothetical protein
MTRQDRIEQQAREMCSFLLSHAGDFWPAKTYLPDLPTALEGLHVQMGKLLDALEEK